MVDTPPMKTLYRSDRLPELASLYDLRRPEAHETLEVERQAWGAFCELEMLDPDHLVLLIKPGGALETGR